MLYLFWILSVPVSTCKDVSSQSLHLFPLSLLSSLACIWHQAHAHNIFGGNKKDAVELFSSQSIVNDCKVGSMVPGGECPSSKCWLRWSCLTHRTVVKIRWGHWLRHAADTNFRAGRHANGPLSLSRKTWTLSAFHFHTPLGGREARGDHCPARGAPVPGGGPRGRQEPVADPQLSLTSLQPHARLFQCSIISYAQLYMF